MAVNDIKEIRILPSLAIARFGSSPEPMDNYDIILPPRDAANGQDGTGFRSLAPAPTLNVVDGRISQESTPARVAFRDAQGRVKPVAPFVEVWARFEDEGDLEPLTLQHLADLNLSARDISWRVEVVNQKAHRRTGDANDRVTATIDDIRDHVRRPLEGTAVNFKAGKSIPFGHVQYIEPTQEFPEIRLRFTPAAGRVFGPNAGDPNLADDVYDSARGNWDNYRDDLPNVPLGTSPGGIYARGQNGLSLGYFDDACDGLIEVKLEVNGADYAAHAHIASGPPDFAPDSYHVRTVSDELEQIVLGHEIPGDVGRADMIDIIRRAVETVRLMNTEAMNGSPPFLGTASNMSGHDSSERALESIFPPALVDEAQVRSFHADALAALLNGEEPWFANILRRPENAGDLTNAGRRRMPAMMRGGDAQHLTLTRRQIAKIEAGADGRISDELVVASATPAIAADTAEADMHALIAHFRNRAPLHQSIDVDGGGTLADLFSDDTRLMDYLKTEVAKGDEAGPVDGQPLVVPGDPDASAFLRLLRRTDHPMSTPYSRVVPNTGGRTGLEIVERWIRSLPIA
ncbi:hypothetical protein HA461_25815 (plasmid) [Rhizobium leguminosarum bv. trifolii]|uniref:hypothetical protein n=1 Tax=Rhizobium leguminosarum TaxID=384 RepID=UPI00140FDF26|nr:hypothetical protein [Rhizobium leguminosarum]QIO54608.1 hypothetical protein HA461_25815 [Rhizobium leguminosarum bv. trifolii]